MNEILDYWLDRILLPTKTAPSKWEKFKGVDTLGKDRRLTPAMSSADIVAVLNKSKVVRGA